MGHPAGVLTEYDDVPSCRAITIETVLSIPILCHLAGDSLRIGPHIATCHVIKCNEAFVLNNRVSAEGYDRAISACC